MHPIKQPPLASKGATQLDEVQPSGGSGPVLRGPDSGADSPGGRARRATAAAERPFCAIRPLSKRSLGKMEPD